MGSCPGASTKRGLHTFHGKKLMSNVREIDFDKLIQDFAKVKSRKVSGL